MFAADCPLPGAFQATADALPAGQCYVLIGGRVFFVKDYGTLPGFWVSLGGSIAFERVIAGYSLMPPRIGRGDMLRLFTFLAVLVNMRLDFDFLIFLGRRILCSFFGFGVS